MDLMATAVGLLHGNKDSDYVSCNMHIGCVRLVPRLCGRNKDKAVCDMHATPVQLA